MLHYFVYAHNMNLVPDSQLEESYFNKLSSSFILLSKEVSVICHNASETISKRIELFQLYLTTTINYT